VLLPAVPRPGPSPALPVSPGASVAAPWVAALGVAATCLLSLMGPQPRGLTLSSLPPIGHAAGSESVTEPVTVTGSESVTESVTVTGSESVTEPEPVTGSESVTEPVTEPLPPFAVERLGSPSVALVLHRIGPVDVVPLYSVNGLAPSPPAPVPARVRTRLAPELTSRDRALRAMLGR
jgi:hypothetical protein